VLCRYQDLLRHPRHPSAERVIVFTGFFAGCPVPCSDASDAWRSRTHIKMHSVEEDQAQASPRIAKPWLSVFLPLGRATAESVTETTHRAMAGHPQARGQQLPDSRESGAGKELARQLCPCSAHPDSSAQRALHPRFIIRHHSKERLPV